MKTANPGHGKQWHNDRQKFINRMQHKLEVKKALYPDGLEHRFENATEIGLQEKPLYRHQ